MMVLPVEPWPAGSRPDATPMRTRMPANSGERGLVGPPLRAVVLGPVDCTVHG